MGPVFDVAAKVLIDEHEGGFCNYDNDPGGATNFGISKVIRDRLSLTPHDLEIPDFSDASIRSMPRRAAERIYFLHWWIPWQLWKVRSQTIATKLLDFGVNANPPCIAIGFAQQTCGALGHALRIDSVMGPLTIAAINACSADAWSADAWMRDYCGRQLAFYERILRRRPSMEIPWRRVWTKRATWGMPGPSLSTPIVPPVAGEGG